MPTKPSQVPERYLDKIVLGDCSKLLRQLPDRSVDLVVSSPPYNIGKEYEDRQSLDRYLHEQGEVLKECQRILKDSGSIFWQVGAFSDNETFIPLDIPFFSMFEKMGLHPRNRIVWVRTHGVHASKRFSCRHETILWFTKTKRYKFNLDPIRVPQKYPHKTEWEGPNRGELTCNPLGKNPGDVWVFRNVKHNHEEQTIHPCQFPEDLIERIVLSTTVGEDVVLDPYMGVGTVAVVARNLGRRFTGAEIDKRYHEVAMNRIEGTSGHKGAFPNLKTLRDYAEKHEIENLEGLRFAKQVGKVPTPRSRAKIFDEQTHLVRFVQESEEQSEGSAFRRGLTDKDGKVIKVPKLVKKARSIPEKGHPTLF